MAAQPTNMGNLVGTQAEGFPYPQTTTYITSWGLNEILISTYLYTEKSITEYILYSLFFSLIDVK